MFALSNAGMSRALVGLPVRPSPFGGKIRSRSSRSVVTHASADLVAEGLRFVLAAPVMYGLVSANEYATHRYYQHCEFNQSELLQKAWCFVMRVDKAPKVKGGGHVEHHAETLDDMSLKIDDAWLKSAPAQVLDGNKYRGTAFQYDITGMMLLQMLPTSIPVLALMGYGPVAMAALILGSVLVHALIWNSLHPAMHGLDDVPAQDGLPSNWLAGLRDSQYYNWLYKNHQGHHILSGKCNYNVCCPLFDHVMGTYVPEEEWMPKANMPANSENRPLYPAGEYAQRIQEKELQQKELALVEA